MDLLALADFNLVARHGSFGEAARATGRPKATLSRRVSELEGSLELRLFERGSRGLKLTQEGQALYERTGTLLAEIAETAAAIASGSERPRGRLRISAPMLFSQVAMGKLVATFALKYPEVQLEVTTEDRGVDMIEEGYDLVIRVNPDPDESLIGRVFLRDRLAVVATPELERPSGKTVVPAVLRGAGTGSAAWDVTGPHGKSRIAIRPVAHLSSLIMVRDTVRLGVGAACLPVSLVAHDLEAGTLVHWGDVDGPDIALWALYPSRRLLSARVSAFLEHLKDAFPTGEPQELAAYMHSSPQEYPAIEPRSFRAFPAMGDARSRPPRCGSVRACAAVPMPPAPIARRFARRPPRRRGQCRQPRSGQQAQLCLAFATRPTRLLFFKGGGRRRCRCSGCGVSQEFAKNWTLVGTVAYLPRKTTSTITLRSQAGQVPPVNKTEIDVKPVVFSLNVGYRFQRIEKPRGGQARRPISA